MDISEKFQRVIKASRAILEKDNFEETAREIFDQCCELTGAVSGYVALLSEDGSENEVLFLEAGNMPCTVDPELPMPIRGLRENAYRTHKPVYENDFMNSKWVEFMPKGHVYLKNVMFAPLNIDGKTVGIMGLANKNGDFTNEDAETASVFGDLAAVALSKSRNLELLEEKNHTLEEALEHIQTLHGLIPICMSCKSVRDDDGYWKRVEAYISSKVDVQFTHGMCPDCIRKYFPAEADKMIGDLNKQFKKGDKK